MSTLHIGGISVQFPHAPYPCQVVYMEKVILALKGQKNALLESPTGTGKTMSLLCSSLAWQTSVNAARSSAASSQAIQYSSEEISASFPVSFPALKPAEGSVVGSQYNPIGRPGFIIYASRTHAQLQQVVQELKRTAYAPNVVILGSRDQLCINDSLKSKHLKGSSLDQACNSLCSQHRCYFKNNAEKKNQVLPPNIMDIEDAVTFGRTNNVCPYFASRTNAAKADLILMPYNYLLDNSIRASLQLEWHKAVVIFDEAHNLEEAASSSASFTLSNQDLQAATKELQYILSSLSPSTQPTNEPIIGSKDPFPAANLSSMGAANIMPSAAELWFLIRVLQQLESRLETIPLTFVSSTSTHSRDMEGIFLLDLFIAAGIAVERAKEMVVVLKNCANILLESSLSSTGFTTSRTPTPKLQLVARCVEQLYKTYRRSSYGDLKRICLDYRLYICQETSKSGATGCSGAYSSFPLTTKRVIHFWAFSGGIAMEELKGLGIKSFILTSGTLAPMDSFKEDMKLPFEICLENPHVISDSQLWVGSFGTGVGSFKLNSSFQSRDKHEYKEELGKSILAICRKLFLDAPAIQGGALVFFPSYSFLENVLEDWRNSKVYDTLESLCGSIVYERRAKSASRTVSKSGGGLNESKNRSAPGKPDTKFMENEEGVEENEHLHIQMENAIQEFNYALLRQKKCLLLAVCRGKLSEGIDFSDARARAVIVVGIPYAPFADPWVVLKRKYLDEKLKSSHGTNSYALPPPNPYSSGSQLPHFDELVKVQRAQVTSGLPRTRLSGQEWYGQSALRAVNQAIGRIIRHKNDWGAVFLLDERFSVNATIKQLSSWIRPRIRKTDSFSASLAQCRSFLTACHLDIKLNVAVMSKPVVLCTAPTNPSATSATSQYHRSVQLSLKGLEEGTVFVDPSVLLSQQPKGVLAQESTGRTIFNFQEMTRIAPQKKPDVTPSIANIFTKSKHGVSKSSNKSVLPKLSLPGSEPPRKVLQLERKIEDVATATPSQVLPKIVTASQVSSSQSSSYQPSKRAKLMTAAFTPGAILASELPQTTGNKNSILSAALLGRPFTFKNGEGVSRSFQTVTSLAKTGPEKENQPADSENSSYTQNTASKLGCIICNESSTELRGAARCGHVCCLGCWTLWLKKSSTCPLCRAPTTSDDISKVYLKRAVQLSQSSEI